MTVQIFNGKKRNKLLAIDLDGTLLTNNKEITYRTLYYLNEAEKYGLITCIATARTFENAKLITDRYNLKLPLICANGAVVKDSFTMKEYFKSTMKYEEAIQIAQYASAMKIQISIFTDKKRYVNKTAEYAGRRNNIKPNTIDEIQDWKNLDIIKIMFHGTDEELRNITEWVKKKNFALNLTYSDDCLIDITHKDVSKGNALKKLASILSIEREEIIAIGNYFNDIDMFRFAGIGVAMGNSPDEVKKEADFVIKTNEEEGVADFLKTQLEDWKQITDTCYFSKIK